MSTSEYDLSRADALGHVGRVFEATRAVPTMGAVDIAYLQVVISAAQVQATLALAAAIASLGAASTTLNPPPGEHTGDQQ